MSQLVPRYVDTDELIDTHCPRCFTGCDCSCCNRWENSNHAARALHWDRAKLPPEFNGRKIYWVDLDTPRRPAPAAEWLDVLPRDAHYYWMHGTECGMSLKSFGVTHCGAGSATCRHVYLPIAKPTPPPKPLPKSRSVELTAKVVKLPQTGWGSRIYWDGALHSVGVPLPSKDEVIRAVRETLGIEPTAEEP